MPSIFTKIVKGEIPSYKVAEDENHFAFLDINPVVEGHTLVIPKKEVDYIYDLEDENLNNLVMFSKKIAKAIDATLGTLRTGIIVEGLEVPHAHIHLVPIYYKGQPMKLGSKIKISEDRMKDLAHLISNAVEL